MSVLSVGRKGDMACHCNEPPHEEVRLRLYLQIALELLRDSDRCIQKLCGLDRLHDSSS